MIRLIENNGIDFEKISIFPIWEIVVVFFLCINCNSKSISE